MQSVVLATVLTTVAAQYAAPTTTPAVVVETEATTAPVYYCADYDTVLVSGAKSLYYTSSLNVASKERVATAAVNSWSAPVNVGIEKAGVYDLKGATFCGAKDAATGKYTQVFVADAGTETGKGAVYGWDVACNEAAPDQVVLSNKWTVYSQSKSQVTDVECGPNDGLFVADKGTNAVYWVTNADLKAKGTPEYAEVIPASCGAAVAEVRSLNYDAKSGQLAWTNNAAADVESAAVVPDAAAGVFQYGAVSTMTPQTADCAKAACDAWSKDCSSDIEQVVAPEVNETGNATGSPQYWAVAQAWGEVQVSTGGADLYEASALMEEQAKAEPLASVTEEVTYAQQTPAGNVLVSDQQAGEVWSVAQTGDTKKIANVKDAYGVAYNQGKGWNGVDGGSASSIVIAAGAVLAAVALLF